MRIDANDEEVARYIREVKVDGRRVNMATTIDTEEGWVEVKIPKIQHASKVNAGQQVDISDDNAGQFQFDWETKRLLGKVEVVWYEDTPTHYRFSGAGQE